MAGNFVKISRSILEWEWYSDINTYRLFTHMIFKANWKDKKFQGKNIERGSFVSSIRKLAEETGLTEREIRTAISHLKSTGEVTSIGHSKYSVFTVTNYDLYQSNDTQEVNQETSERHSNDIQTTTIEEIKKGKQERNNPLSPLKLFEDFWDSYPNPDCRNKTEHEYCDAVMSGVDEIVLVQAAKNYYSECSALQREAQFITRSDNFFRNCKFEKYTDANYKPPKAVKNKSTGFSNAPERKYDMDDLERRLVQT